ncbi:hypothetical protein [Calidifontibacter terrae]
MPAPPLHDDVRRRLVSIVPTMLAVHAETVTDTTTRTLAMAVEHVADGLLAWHDALIGGTPPHLALAAGMDTVPTTFRPLNAGAYVTTELAGASLDLRRCGELLQSVVDQVSDDTLRPTGQALADVVRSISELLQVHVEELRAVLPGRGDVGGAAKDVRAAKVARAERVLQRRLIATLRG